MVEDLQRLLLIHWRLLSVVVGHVGVCIYFILICFEQSSLRGEFTVAANGEVLWRLHRSKWLLSSLCCWITANYLISHLAFIIVQLLPFPSSTSSFLANLPWPSSFANNQILTDRVFTNLLALPQTSFDHSSNLLFFFLSGGYRNLFWWANINTIGIFILYMLFLFLIFFCFHILFVVLFAFFMGLLVFLLLSRIVLFIFDFTII